MSNEIEKIKSELDALKAKQDAKQKKLKILEGREKVKRRQAENHIKLAAGGSLLAYLKEHENLPESFVREVLGYCEFGITSKEPARSQWEAIKAAILKRYHSNI
jgi:hypothetical protein